MQNKLFVGNLPWSLRGDDLRELFSKFGEIEDAFVMTDRQSGRSKGFGFVTFVNEDDARAAAEAMNEQEVEGRKITVDFAKPKQ